MGPTLAPKPAQFWPSSAEFGPTKVNLGRCCLSSTKFGRVQTNVGRHRPEYDRCRSKFHSHLTKFGPKPPRSGVGPNLVQARPPPSFRKDHRSSHVNRVDAWAIKTRGRRLYFSRPDCRSDEARSARARHALARLERRGEAALPDGCELRLDTARAQHMTRTTTTTTTKTTTTTTVNRARARACVDHASATWAASYEEPPHRSPQMCPHRPTDATRSCASSLHEPCLPDSGPSPTTLAKVGQRSDTNLARHWPSLARARPMSDNRCLASNKSGRIRAHIGCDRPTFRV